MRVRGGADPKSSFGDFAALSDPVDAATADYLRGVVSDGVIAPGFLAGALDVLAAKKRGTFLVLEANPDYAPPLVERREVFGVTLTQARNSHRIGAADLADLACGALTDNARRDLLLGLVTLKYTQSNSVGLRPGRADDRRGRGPAIPRGLHEVGRREGGRCGTSGGIRTCSAFASVPG